MIQRTLIVGCDEDAQQLAATLASAPDSSYVVVGHLDERREVGEEIDGRPVLGRPANVLEYCEAYRVGFVIVSPAGVEPGTLQDLTIALEGSDVDLAVAPSLFEVVTRRMTIETVGNVPLLHVDQIRLRRGKATLKRTLDLVVAVRPRDPDITRLAGGRGRRPQLLARPRALPAASRRPRRT
jgi:FlaA1/EpsC-like NDP-sugar epimerase